MTWSTWPCPAVATRSNRPARAAKQGIPVSRLSSENETGGRFAPLPRWIPSPSSRASYIDAQDAQADSFSLLVATATRFEIGCVISPIIFIIISVERALSAISVSNAVRA